MGSVTAFEILKPGLLATIQDRGRFGCAAVGVAPSGALDTLALRLGNLLVDNSQNEAGLECLMMGLEIIVLEEVAIAVTGADLDCRVDNRPLPLGCCHVLRRDQVLSMNRPVHGCRAYICVGGGFDIPIVLGSKSTNLSSGFGGFHGRPLAPGDRLAVCGAAGHLRAAGRRLPQALVPIYPQAWFLRVLPGPQDDQFTWTGVETFLNAEYRVSSSSDRTGIRLQGPGVEREGSQPESIISEGVVTGTIQVPGDGMPIIILNETASGGYRKIATVISADRHLLGQIQPGDRVWFKAVTLDAACEALRQLESGISRFKDSL